MAGYRILEVTGSRALASGYFVDAVRSLRRFGGEGVCQMLRKRMPEYISLESIGTEPPAVNMFKSGPIHPPQLLRSTPSSHETVTSSDDVSLEDDTHKSENLDTVT